MAASLPFNKLCSTLEMIDTLPRKNRFPILEKFIMTNLRPLIAAATDPEEHRLGLFPVARLLLPSLDQKRGSYGIKESKLAQRYIRVLGLPPKGEDAMRLLNYRAPSANAGLDLAGDFAAVASHVLSKVLLHTEPSKLTVGEVNQHLDNLALSNALHNSALVNNVLESLLRTTNATEQKWVIRILMKTVKFGLGQKSIFKCIHPDAEKMFTVCSDLQSVCEKLSDLKVRLNEVEVMLGKAFAPMLAVTADVGKLGTFFTPERKTLYVETKLDGERYQIHREANGLYRFFSRNAFDYSESFGSNAHEGPLTSRLEPLLSQDVSTFIIDGEMMTWNIERKKFKQKGSQGLDVKHLSKDTKNAPCFCVFDILYLNGRVLTNQPLEDRLKILRTIFTEMEGVFVDTPRWKVQTEEDIRDSLNRAIDNQDEGIMLKDPLSVYRPSERKAGWWKVKPEYNDSLMEHLDLLILGGYYGSGARGGANFSRFLLGVAVPSPVLGAEPTQFLSICRVGSGYSRIELDMLNSRLESHWINTCPSNVISANADKPDKWIEPKKSVVLEVKATEITASNVYAANCTLRFPRMEQVRLDLNWLQCLTTPKLEDIRTMSAGKLTSRHATNSMAPNRKKRVAPIKADIYQLPSQFQPADVSGLAQETNKLQGKELCIINADQEGPSKQDLEKLVVQHGGTITQNPRLGKTWACIASSGILRVKMVVAGGEHGAPKFDVLLPSWLLGLVKGERPLEPEPRDLLYSSYATQSRLSISHDCYGDSFTKPATRESLNFILEHWTLDDDNEPLEQDTWDLEETLLQGTNLKNIFRPCLAYFDQYQSLTDTSTRSSLFWPLELAKKELQFYGGRATDKLEPTKVTHVVVHPDASTTRVEEIKQLLSASHMFHVVRQAWVTQSRARGRLLREQDFPATS